MAMSVGKEDGEESAMSEINTTPLVDVMLVMLIIFLITIPAVLQVAKVELPNSRSTPLTTKPENIVISVDHNGNLYQGAQKMRYGRRDLLDMCGKAVKAAVDAKKPIPEVHIRGDKDAQFQYIGAVLITVQQCQIQKVGFISEPAIGVTF